MGEPTEYVYTITTNRAFTALMEAAREGHCGIVEILSQHEAGMRQYMGLTALIYAILEGHSECVAALAEAESHLCSYDGKSPVAHALDSGHKYLLPYLKI